MPTFCFRTGTLGSSDSVYCRSKGMAVWLEFALSQSCVTCKSGSAHGLTSYIKCLQLVSRCMLLPRGDGCLAGINPDPFLLQTRSIMLSLELLGFHRAPD